LHKTYSIFGDDYALNLFSKCDVEKYPYPSKNEIMTEFKNIKNDLFGSFFFNTKRTPSLFKFFLISVLGKLTSVALNIYHPSYNQINSTDPIFIKKIKSLCFIKYYIDTQNYSSAYSYFKYLSDHKPQYFNLQKMIDTKIKYHILTNLLEHNQLI
jgi:hypothetical protein